MNKIEKRQKFLEIVKEFNLVHKNDSEYTLPGARSTDFLIFYNDMNDEIQCAVNLRELFEDYFNDVSDYSFGFQGIESLPPYKAKKRVIKILKQYKQHLNNIKKLEMEKDFI